jgi:uncharacterized protein (DUF934 family)
MPLVKAGKLAEDSWQKVDPEATEIPAGDHLLVTLDQWNEHKVDLCKRGGVFGVQLSPDQGPEQIADDLVHFGLIALEFPVFTDGRAYSHARLLRERYGFEGEIRAVGDVLLEQLVFMDRAGFDAFEIDSESAVEDWQTAFADIDVFYQPTGDGRETAVQARWRR